MPQPNKGGHGTPHTQQPLMDKKAPAPKQGDLRLGFQPGGTKGTGKGSR